MSENDEGKKQRRTDLEVHIRDAQRLLNAYENDLLLGSPSEKVKAEKEIPGLKRQIAEYEAELARLDSVSEHKTAVEKELENPLSEIQESLRGLHHEVHQGFDDVLKNQDVILKIITPNDRKYLESILDYIRSGQAQQLEMRQTLENIGDAIRIIKQNNKVFDEQVVERINGLEDAFNSDMSLQSKLELTLPIIPIFFNYKVEFGLGDTVDLNKVGTELGKRWNNFLGSASVSSWNSNILEAFGELVLEGGNALDTDFREVARLTLGNYKEKLDVLDILLEGYEKKIDRETISVSALLTIKNELIESKKLFNSFLDLIVKLEHRIKVHNIVPIVDLRRAAEVNEDLIGITHSAANQAASGQSMQTFSHQIKREVLELSKLTKRICKLLTKILSDLK